MATFSAILYKSGWATPHIHLQADDGSWTENPGYATVPLTTPPHPYYAGWHLALVEGYKATFAFNDGAQQWDNNGGKDYNLERPGVYVLEDGVLTKLGGTPGATQPAVSVILYHTTWSPAFLHHTTGAGSDGQQWTALPGSQALPLPAHFVQHVAGQWVVGLVGGDSVAFAWTDGVAGWDSNQGANYTIGQADVYELQDGVLRGPANERKRKQIEVPEEQEQEEDEEEEEEEEVTAPSAKRQALSQPEVEQAESGGAPAIVAAPIQSTPATKTPAPTTPAAPTHTPTRAAATAASINVIPSTPTNSTSATATPKKTPAANPAIKAQPATPATTITAAGTEIAQTDSGVPSGDTSAERRTNWV